MNLKKNTILIIILVIFISILPINKVYAYTVDDVRDIIGKARVDETFTDSEIAEIVRRYNEIERANIYARMFELGKTLDVDSEVEKDYVDLEKEVTLLQDSLIQGFKKGVSTFEVLESKSKLEVTLHKVDSLKEKGVTLELEYIVNDWEDKYNKVQEMIEKMEEDYEIGVVGEGLRSPVYSGFFITSPFGFRLDPVTLSEVTYHNGLDLAAYMDEPVLAQWNGVISNVYYSETGGNVVEITHGKGLKTMYLHLNSSLVEIGQKIRQYEVIGRAGSTGTRSTGPHLHLIVELDGEKINPIYLYGSMGLNAFKTYISYNPERNRELPEIVNNLKEKPTKIVEEEQEHNTKYFRPGVVVNEDEIQLKPSSKLKEPTPFIYGVEIKLKDDEQVQETIKDEILESTEEP